MDNVEVKGRKRRSKVRKVRKGQKKLFQIKYEKKI